MWGVVPKYATFLQVRILKKILNNVEFNFACVCIMHKYRIQFHI